jgi:PAS domain S-box-containing protein
VLEYVSPGVATLTGYSPEEFYRDPGLAMRIVHPDDRPIVSNLQNAGSEGLVIRWLHRSGRQLYVEPRVVLLRDAQGVPCAVEGIVRDVTARVLAEEALRESSARLRSVFAAMAEGVLFYDADGRLVDCNAAAERMLRRPRERLLGCSIQESWHAVRDDGTPFPPSEYPASRTLLTGLPVRNALMGLVQPDGSLRWLSMSSEPLGLPSDLRPGGVLASFADMTAERRAWVEVRRREAQLRLAMECAGHAFWELDLSHDPPGELEAPGRLPAEMVRWMAQVHAEDRPRALAELEEHVQGRTPAYLSEFRLAGPDGELRWVQASGRAVARDEAGRATRLAGTVTDVTEAKRLRERLRQADRLAGVGTLAAGVAHEVNNPLAYVTANLTLLDEALARLRTAIPGESPAAAPFREMGQALRDAMDGAARVRGIVQGLRQFSQPPRGEERAAVDLKAEIEAAIGIARNEISHRAQLRVDLPDRLPPVKAGSHEVGQVLVNLLINAAQAIPEGRAAENEVRISARAEGERVLVAVSDTGAGIPPADLPRIFDPFFTTKPVGAGTGLGLSVCHGIVTALGGSIDVESAPARGTTVRVGLPALRAEPPRPPAPATAAPARRGRVLVVDDEALVGKSLGRLLSAHEVTVLSSPLEALRRAEAGERWDVVLCDLMMPELSGMDLEDRLAVVAPELVVRTIYLTGGAFTDRSREFLGSGRPHLEKPVDPAELRARVAERVAATRKDG